ncbi:splicing factor C9orf78 isoform X2 [Phymastichus coffea]|uniref:splicing factor C9orf78 isoform X2 n=1 Tax=Phymastichus coffea TaxID=108790 RepID=UPI00273BE27A|nr:splicing factor C9orf78 isoform X2 [Phymastichus coffea]XP_058793385.1 splicing factor C9orf78 isoform X2 [Phymastichus coffea]
MSSAHEDTKIVFKKKSRKPLRKRRNSSDESNQDDNEEGVRSKLEELKTIQKLRERPNGVNIVGLATGETVSVVETIMTDPFNIKTGGLVDMQALKNAKSTKSDAYDTGIGTQFNAETNKRDEDKEMLKYIEENVARRKNKNKIDTEKDESKSKPLYCSPEEAAFQAVPEHLRQSSSHKSEEMLSNQMLSGIPEVDLGIETKIRNIEATEEAKMKLLWERHKKKDSPSQFVPTNMAVNFVQHNRFNIEDPSAQKRKQDAILQKNAARSSNPRDKRKDGVDEKATDDYHYERFKKQFRRF